MQTKTEYPASYFEDLHITEPQRQHAVGMLEQFTPICSLILHVLVKDGESTNGGFTNNSKTAFKEDRPTR